MKNLTLIFASFIIYSFSFENEPIKFNSGDNKISIEVNNSNWQAAGNMNGIQIFLFKENKKLSDKSICAISKEENLLITTTLEEYAAGKIFLQSAVLGANIIETKSKTVNGISSKVFEYTYLDNENEELKSIVYFFMKGNTAYQMSFTSKSVLFEMNRVVYNEIAGSLTLN